jgi:hypothetical protein
LVRPEVPRPPHFHARRRWRSSRGRWSGYDSLCVCKQLQIFGSAEVSSKLMHDRTGYPVDLTAMKVGPVHALRAAPLIRHQGLQAPAALESSVRSCPAGPATARAAPRLYAVMSQHRHQMDRHQAVHERAPAVRRNTHDIDIQFIIGCNHTTRHAKGQRNIPVSNERASRLSYPVVS